MQEIKEILKWLRENDIPNWIAIIFSAFLWPGLLYWWYKRKVQEVPNLEVLLSSTETQIGYQPFAAVGFQFTNRTGSVVYINRVRLKEHTRTFQIPSVAVRDLAGGWREIKFLNEKNHALELHEFILQTSQSAHTSIAVTQAMSDDFYAFRPTFLRKILRKPKYFVVQYTAMVGDSKFSVSTIF